MLRTAQASDLRLCYGSGEDQLVLVVVRTRRASLGWSPDTTAWGGAAALETGVPELTLSIHSASPLAKAGLRQRAQPRDPPAAPRDAEAPQVAPE
jgi:hypothetical protein